MKGVKRLVSFTILVVVCLSIVGCSNIQETVSIDSNETQKENRPILAETKSNNSSYDDNLKLANEEIIFSFKTEKNGKVLSVCISQEPDYIVYRFGSKDNVELEYPSNKTDSWNCFTYDYYLRGGGAANEGVDLNYLSFERENYIYRVYDEYYAASDSNSVGVKVIDKITNKEIDISGISKEKIGTLVTLRESKIKHGSDNFTGF